MPALTTEQIFDAVLRVQLQRVGNFRQHRGIVRIKNILLQRAREEGIVHPVENVGHGRVFTQDGPIERRARVAAQQNQRLAAAE